MKCAPSCSGVHRLFEGQGQKGGHFSARFGSQEGTLARVFASKRAVYNFLTSQGGQFSVFFQLRGHFSARFDSQEGTLAHVLTPKRAL